MKRTAASLSCLILILASLLTSCLGGTPAVTDAPASSGGVATESAAATDTPTTDARTAASPGTETAAAPGTTMPAVTTKAPEVTTGPAVVPEPETLGSLGTLLYYEDFEGYGTVSATSSTISKLGWTIQNTIDGAYKNSTADYSLVKRNGGNQLYISNNKSGAADSYVMLLSDNQFGFFHRYNYTFQYDIEYADAGDNARYIALVTEYSGPFYDSFHFRNSGYGNNQCHASGVWYTYDDSASADYAADNSTTSKNTIAYKLLGKYCNGGQLFNGISVSVRYVMDWDKGNSVYMRVNTQGYANTGKWVLISKYSINGTASRFLSPDAGGAAVVLKTGTTQNGYIDNIIIWRGTGEEPAAKTNAILTSKTSGNLFINLGGVDTCVYTGKGRGIIESGGWLLDDVPVYAGGIKSNALYKSGPGLTADFFKPSEESLMQLVSSTTAAQFSAYLEKLSSSGYKQEYYDACENNLYASYTNGKNRIYAYFTGSSQTVRVILDKNSDCSASDFGYTYEKKPGDTTVLYQYGVPMNEAGVNIANNSEKKIDCGMMYVIKLADNSVVIIDGGGYQQFDSAQIDGLMDFLRAITGVGASGKVRISGWYITHGHSDHFAGFCLFIKKYSSSLTVERIFFNFPSVSSNDATLSGHFSNYAKLIVYINTYLGSNITYLKPHTGQVIKLADVDFQVLYTHEDIVNASSAVSGIAGDFNNSSLVLKITFDGKTFMLLGDINRPAMTILMKNYSSVTLKADVVQLAHHVINNLSELYHVIQASVVLIPQSPNGSVVNSTRRAAFDAAYKYIKNYMYYFASKGTNGISVVNGELSMTFSDKVYGGAYITEWGW